MKYFPLSHSCSIAIIAIILLALTSCVKEELTINDPAAGISPVFGVPLLKADISAQRVIERYDPNGEVVEEIDKVLSLVYRDTLTRIRADDYLTFPDQTFSRKYTLTSADLTELEQSGQLGIESEEMVSIDLGQDRLDSIRFASGQFALSITADGNIPISGSFSLLDPISNEIILTFQFSHELPPIYLDAEVDLQNILFRFINDDEFTNGLKFVYTLNLESNAGLSPEKIKFEGAFIGATIASAGGYIAPRDLILDRFDTHISMYDTDFHGEFRLEDPRINVYFQNGFGLTIQPVPDRVEGINVNGETLVVEGNNITPFPSIAAATAPGMTPQTTMSITNETMTPTVTDFMAFEPQYIYGDFHLRLNPDNQPSSFVNSSSELEIRFEVEIPLYGSLSDYWMADTTRVDLKDIADASDDFEQIDEIQFRLFVENAMPVDAAVQLVFLDSNFQAIDSLFDGVRTVIASAPVNLTGNRGVGDYGRVTGTTSSTVDVTIARKRAQALRHAAYIIIKVEGHTTSNADHPIRIYPEDHVSVHLAAKAQFNFD